MSPRSDSERSIDDRRREERRKYALLSDQPVLEFGVPLDDYADSSRTESEPKELEACEELEFARTARVLAQATLYTEDPITIGVYGKWGTGKTSLMRLMMKVVEDEGRGENAAVPVWFNAWQYEREDHLIIPLLATIGRDIRKREEIWEAEREKQNRIALDNNVDDAVRKAAAASRETAEKGLGVLRKGGEKMHAALRSVLYGIAMKGKLGVPLMGEIAISASAKDMIERYEALTQDTMMARSLYFDAFDRLRDLAYDPKVEKPQIVVFIDDLDRCLPENAVRLIENIKLVLHQPNFAFVLGIDHQIIEDFIRNKYAAGFALKDLAATSEEARHRLRKYLDYFDDYLGKIVQVRYDVPTRKTEKLHGYIRKRLETLEVLELFTSVPAGSGQGESGGGGSVKESDILDLIAEVGRRNPREIVRAINRQLVVTRIDDSFDEAGKLKEDAVPPAAGLIDTLIYDRRRRDRERYGEFLPTIQKKDATLEKAYGKALADALAKVDEEETGDAFVKALRSRAKEQHPEKKEVEHLNTLVLALESDISTHDGVLTRILRSPLGRRWLTDPDFRRVPLSSDQEEESEAGEMPSQRRGGESEDAFDEQALAALVEMQGSGNMKGSVDFSSLLDGFKLIDIPDGTFRMGSPKNDDVALDSEKPDHQVTVRSFYMSDTPITQAQFQKVMGYNPSRFRDSGESEMERGERAEDRPVERVSWRDARLFCETLTNLARGVWRFSLPSEAQWEYACRAGSTTRFCFGDDKAKLNDYAWYAENSNDRTHAVRGKERNNFGLYDMHGNVWEWCQDAWHGNYKDAPEDETAWEDDSAPFRVVRGGSWGTDARGCRSATRAFNHPGNRGPDIGFRVIAVRKAGGAGAEGQPGGVSGANPSGARDG